MEREFSYQIASKPAPVLKGFSLSSAMMTTAGFTKCNLEQSVEASKWVCRERVSVMGLSCVLRLSTLEGSHARPRGCAQHVRCAWVVDQWAVGYLEGTTGQSFSIG